MTRDDIIRMAREAGYQPLNPDAIFDCLQEVFFERFAELVKQHIQIELMPKFEELAEIVRNDERERCAKVCEETTIAWTEQAYNNGCTDCAQRIRSLRT